MIEIDTRKPVEAIDITGAVQRSLEKSGVREGICLVYTLHTTTGIIINEAEPNLIQDILDLTANLVPENQGYGHDKLDGNAHAHLRAILLGNSAVIPVEKGALMLGTWQRILFLEMDGPRRRRIYAKALSVDGPILVDRGA
jgi:secondary thiamine-phosphate synthase enzyme